MTVTDPIRATKLDGRGPVQVHRLPEARKCTKQGCGTVLSAYNTESTCFCHTPPDYRDPAKCAGLPRGRPTEEGVVLDFTELKKSPRGIALRQAEHGSYGGYKAGCRCVPCRRAMSESRRNARRRRDPRRKL